MSRAALNLALYAVLIVVYFLVVLQWLNVPLARLFQENMERYAFVAVLLILGQGLLLDLASSSLMHLTRYVINRWRE